MKKHVITVRKLVEILTAGIWNPDAEVTVLEDGYALRVFGVRVDTNSETGEPVVVLIAGRKNVRSAHT